MRVSVFPRSLLPWRLPCPALRAVGGDGLARHAVCARARGRGRVGQWPATLPRQALARRHTSYYGDTHHIMAPTSPIPPSTYMAIPRHSRRGFVTEFDVSCYSVACQVLSTVNI